MLEFSFSIPVLLLIAGATVDISRYMRYQQITTFVSQEAGSEIYQQCSDITVYCTAADPADECPATQGSDLRVHSDKTKAAILLCAQRIQNQTQQLLNNALGRASISSDVFRYNIGNADTSPDNCTSSNGTAVTRLQATASSTGTGTPDWASQGVGYDDLPTEETLKTINGTGGFNLGSDTKPMPKEVNPEIYDNNKRKLKLENGSISVTAGNKTYNLVNSGSLCTRGRVVAVEVAHDFDPIINFLPGMMPKLDKDGNQREITIF